ncbi:MAG TPA: hypothetical protein VI011_11360 [Asanoa sp.]
MRAVRGRSALPDVPVVVLGAGRTPAGAMGDRTRTAHEAIAARGSFVPVDDGGHDLHRHRPDAVVEAVDPVSAQLP